LSKLDAWIQSNTFPNLHIHTGGGGVENLNTAPAISPIWFAAWHEPNGILILEKKGRRILLAAPTGRAAKRSWSGASGRSPSLCV
jgi:hypothetical protein